MKKFSFRLQTVLDMREKVLEKKQLEMAGILNILNQQIDRLNNLLAKKENTRNSLESIYENSEELDILEVTNYKNFLSKVINDAKNQDFIIQNTKMILEVKRSEVAEALKEVKVLEKLKEKQEKKFYQHYEYVQAKEIDDIASTRYQRIAS